MSSQSLSITFTGMSLTLNAMPAVPPPLRVSPRPFAPLFVSCPMVPLT
jgi:hypothetical protein